MNDIDEQTKMLDTTHDWVVKQMTELKNKLKTAKQEDIPKYLEELQQIKVRVVHEIKEINILIKKLEAD